MLQRALLAAFAGLFLAALQSLDAPTPRNDTYYQGQLLVAAPSIGDPRFDGAVVYLVHHDDKGAFGIIINKPAGEHRLAEVLKAMGEEGGGDAGSVTIFFGGPVQPELGFVLHSTDYNTAHTVVVDDKVAVTQDPQILRDIAAGKGPAHKLVAFGYAGWAPGQLEAELARNAWYVAPADVDLLFNADRDTVWQKAFDKKTLRL